MIIYGDHFQANVGERCNYVIIKMCGNAYTIDLLVLPFNTRCRLTAVSPEEAAIKIIRKRTFWLHFNLFEFF